MKRFRIVLILSALILFSACALPLPGLPADETPAATATQVIDDVVATLVAGTVTSMPTVTPYPTETPRPAEEAQATADTVSSAGSGAAALSTMVLIIPTVDVKNPIYSGPIDTGGTPTALATVQGTKEYACQLISWAPADWQRYRPGDTFDAAWEFLNAGTENWVMGDVELAFVGGDTLHDQSTIHEFALAKEVEPNKTIKWIVDMTAPKEEGYYSSYWALTQDGDTFCKFTVNITVQK